MTEPPTDLDQLCADLGVGLKRRARLAQEHGEDLIPWLQKVWRWARAQDVVRIPAKQAGHLHPHQYTQSTVAGLNEEPEAVPPEEIASYRVSRQARDLRQAQILEELGGLLGALRDLRNAIDAMPAKRRQSMSRTLYTLKLRINATEREMRRQAAA